MSHKIRKSLPKNPQTGRKEKSRQRRQKESDRRRGVREEQIILFWSRRIVTAVRRVAARLRFLDRLTQRLAPLLTVETMEGGREAQEREELNWREVVKTRRETAA